MTIYHVHEFRGITKYSHTQKSHSSENDKNTVADKKKTCCMKCFSFSYKLLSPF